ncbi:L,D-transpeptidase catalytic domain [compost metagenome]
MKAVLAILGFVVTSALLVSPVHAQEINVKLQMVDDPYEAPKGQLFDEESYFKGETWLNQYVNVIVINKAAKGPGAQTLRLYTNRQLQMTTKISSGREDLEIVNPVAGIFRKIFNTKGTKESHWRHTTRGYYNMKRVYGAGYRSGESRAQMPYAMFFNESRGLAVHQVPPDLAGGEAAGNRALGTRASSGCVRVHGNYILNIYNAVQSAGKGQVPVLNTRTGQPELDSRGEVKYTNNWRTLVIVEEY